MRKFALTLLAGTALAACSDKDEAMLDDAAEQDAAAEAPAEEAVPDAQASMAQAE